MLKIVILVFVAAQVNISFGLDFEKDFTHILQENSNPEQQHYGVTAEGSGGSNRVHSITFPQKLDHFKSTERTTWDQRTIILNTYYEKRAPFFIYIFGNEPASADWLRKSRIMSYAKDHKALVIGLEHRFYGESRPFANTSVENLSHLNIQQALADIAYFIETVNGISLVPADTKWIAFGGFYGGSLAAWARMKYPHLVHGAVASSAPISVKSEFPEYLEAVKNAYLKYNSDPNCGRSIEDAFQQSMQVLQTPEGRAKASKIFSLCSPLENNEDDKAVLLGTLSTVISTAVEQNHDNRFSMSTVCEIMSGNQGSAMENLGSVNHKYLSVNGLRCWYGKRARLVSLFREIHYDRREQSDRLWFYQLCTQFGFNLPSTKSVDMFGEYKPEIESNARYCQDIFGSEYNQQTIDDGVKETNIEFGAQKFPANNVLLVYGEMDPWNSPEIIEIAKNHRSFFIIKDASHLTDLELGPENDDLETGIRKIKDSLNSWLA